jgi:hypothetical protein
VRAANAEFCAKLSKPELERIAVSLRASIDKEPELAYHLKRALKVVEKEISAREKEGGLVEVKTHGASR